MSKNRYPGFPFQLLQFLDSLEKNNHRDWFDKNKPRYEEYLREPALAFIEAMQEPLRSISPYFRAVPKKVGGSLMRIYRDIRFSHDKTPYKTNVGIQFRHEKGKDVHAPGFYLHIDTEQVFLGAGIWRPDSQSLAKIRNHIDRNQARWKKTTAARSFTRNFKPEGDSLKRPPKGYAADHPLIDDLKRKDFIGLCQLDHDFITSSRIVPETCKRLKTSSDYMRFLCDSLKLKF